MASVAQKDPELLYRLRDWFGGSITDSGNGSMVHNWNICGDRARIFIALIYGFMTARRRSQIDATKCLEFLQSASPVGLDIQQLKQEMDRFYENHGKMIRQRVKVSRAKKYKEQSSDLEWAKQTLERNRKSRGKMTEEQKQASRQYQKVYYQSKKSKQLYLVKLDDTA